VEATVPAGATVVVASSGDPELIRFAGRTGWHFPRDAGGGYAGFHPAGDADALRRLDALRAAGATHFLLPATAWWWQTHYREFTADLRRGRTLLDDPTLGLLVELIGPLADAPSDLPAPGRCRVVIPVLDRANFTRACLDAVVRTIPDWTEVVVVDDGSTDDTPQLLAGFGPRVAVIRHDRPAGFAAACNRGAAGASTDHVVFLNNDTIPEPGWLDALARAAARHPEAGVFGAKLLYPDRSVQHAGMAVGQNRHPCHLYAGFPADHPAVNRPREFRMVTGACVLVRRPLFDRLGGFDTGYLNGYEDVDLCLRARAAGHAVRYCPAAVVVHLESATRGASPDRAERDRANWKRFRDRWREELVPDDLAYYQDDGLIQFSYRGPGRPVVSVSPLLGRVVPDPAG
jgi:GT2 family glycosyltransferase